MRTEYGILLAQARRQRSWSQGGTELALRLLAEDAELAEGWTALLEVAVTVAEAHGAMLTTIDPADPATVEVVAAAGGLASLQGCHLADGKSLTRHVLDNAQTIIVSDATADSRTAGLTEVAPQVTSMLAAPIPDLDREDTATQSVLSLSRTTGQDAFRDLETDIVHAFAAQAATTLAMARARHDRERLARLEDRERALTTLQHTVISQLTRSTLTIANVATQISPRLQAMLLEQIDALERLTRTMRDVMFDVPR